jgi:hypothetical protein
LLLAVEPEVRCARETGQTGGHLGTDRSRAGENPVERLTRDAKLPGGLADERPRPGRTHSRRIQPGWGGVIGRDVRVRITIFPGCVHCSAMSDRSPKTRATTDLTTEGQSARRTQLGMVSSDKRLAEHSAAAMRDLISNETIGAPPCLGSGSDVPQPFGMSGWLRIAALGLRSREHQKPPFGLSHRTRPDTRSSFAEFTPQRMLRCRDTRRSTRDSSSAAYGFCNSSNP